MHIKKFTAGSAKDAMKAIKAEFGENALILSNKRIGSGLYEVVAAIEYDTAEPVSVSLPHPVKAAPKAPERKPEPQAKAEPKAKDSDDLGAFLKKELGELKELKEFCKAFISHAKTPVSEVYAKLEGELTANGIDKRLAEKILMSAFKGVAPEKSTDATQVKSCMRRTVLDKLSVADPLNSGGIITFIGPAGVGKTTTIAKLAAIYALKKKKRVALLTMDTYRIAAAEQLKVYGKIMGIPVEVAKNVKELASYIADHKDKDLILIDTAGRNHKNHNHMKDLSEIASLNSRIRFNLVLSSQTRDEALYDCVKRYISMPIDSLTFTKLDEGAVYGPILNTMLLAKKPVAYLTTGQRVPEDIEMATRERLINFFMPN